MTSEIGLQATEGSRGRQDRIRPYAWAVFAISFALMLIDFMARQVIVAVFPLLKADLRLTDSQLGALSGVVALGVGLFTVPLSMAADRLGKVRSIALMAVIWSAATLACGAAGSFHQLLWARLLVGLGEAAYGSVGLAVIFAWFPRAYRATVAGVFLSGAVFGSFLGSAFGGMIGARHGWRWPLILVGLLGLLLAGAYYILVREAAAESAYAPRRPPFDLKALWRALFEQRMMRMSYLGSGLQLFVLGAMTAWIIAFFHRIYRLDVEQAAWAGGGLLLIGGVGMIACGALSDRLARAAPHRCGQTAVIYCLLTAAFLGLAFQLQPGVAQLALLTVGMFVCAGTVGPAQSMVADRSSPALAASTLGVLALANNLLGLAPGAFVTGLLADRFGISAALGLMPLIAVAAAGCLWSASRG